MCHADLDFAVEDAAWAAWLASGRRTPKAQPLPRNTAAEDKTAVVARRKPMRLEDRTFRNEQRRFFLESKSHCRNMPNVHRST